MSPVRQTHLHTWPALIIGAHHFFQKICEDQIITQWEEVAFFPLQLIQSFSDISIFFILI